MTINAILDAIKDIKNGTFVRVEYETIPSMTASAKKSGVCVSKHTTKVARLGVNYGHIAQVIAKDIIRQTSGVEKQEHENPYVWDLKDIIARNINNGNLYLHITNVPENSHTVSEWFVDGKQVDVEEVKQYVVPSYFNRSGELPVVQKININNIIKIGK